MLYIHRLLDLLSVSHFQMISFKDNNSLVPIITSLSFQFMAFVKMEAGKSVPMIRYLINRLLQPDLGASNQIVDPFVGLLVPGASSS